MKSNQNDYQQNLNNMQSSFQFPDNLPPRKFPKGPYKRITRNLWLIIIGIILIIGACGLCFHYYTHTYVHHQQLAQTYRKSRQHKASHSRSYVMKRVRPVQKVTPKKGEYLLGHWLRKLHYSTATANSILSNYQTKNQVAEEKFAQALNRIDTSSASSSVKVRQVRHLIKRL